MKTLTELIDHHGIDVHEHLDRALEIPALAGLQRQGDVIVIPADVEATTPVPVAGVPVVRGEAGGNTHALLADGDVRCDVREASATNLLLAHLTVAEGATAYLAHPEHGYSAIAPGSYVIRRQREMADELRMVQD